MKPGDSNADEPIPGDKQVSEAYKTLSDSKVPAELDARIMAQAREAAKSGNVLWLKRAAIRRWAIPLTTAASVVMVMSVVYEMRFNAPPDAVAVNAANVLQDSSAPILKEEQATSSQPSALASAPAKPSEPRARHITDAISAKAIAPPPVVVGPVGSPVVAPLADTATFTAPAAPPPPAASSEAVVMNNEPQLEKKQAEIKASDDKASTSNQAERAKPHSAMAATQMLGMSTRKADANGDTKVSLASLALLAGHYQYVSYKIIKLSGEVQTLKDLGYTAATLDIDAQGTLTQRMTMASGQVVTQTARVVDLQLEGQSGHWVALWSDMTYPVESSIVFNATKLTSRTQFEYLSDSVRFGNVELATLRRLPER